MVSFLRDILVIKYLQSTLSEMHGNRLTPCLVALTRGGQRWERHSSTTKLPTPAAHHTCATGSLQNAGECGFQR